MTRDQKIWRLNRYCVNHQCNRQECGIYQECSASGGKFFENLDDTKINELHSKLFGTSITDRLTGVITVSDDLKKVKQEMCDGYCVYKKMTPHFDETSAGACILCPLKNYKE